MRLETFVVIPPTLCAALSLFCSVPLSSQGRGGGHGEGTLNELSEFLPVSPETTARRQ